MMRNVSLPTISIKAQKILISAVLFSAIVVSLLGYMASPPIGDDYVRIYGQVSSYGLDFVTFMQGQLRDRPVLMLYIWVGYLLHDGNALWFKLSSILLHALNGVGLFWLMDGIAGLYGMKLHPWKLIVTGILVFAWAIHPMHWAAIASTIQSGVLLSFFFGMGSTFYSLRFLRDRPSTEYLTLAALFFLLSLLSKGTLVLLPFLFLGLPRGAASKKPIFQLVGVLLSISFFYGAWVVSLESHSTGIRIDTFAYYAAEIKVYFWNIARFFFEFEYRWVYDPRRFFQSSVPNECWVGFAVISGYLLLNRLLGQGKWAILTLGAYTLFILPESLVKLPHLTFDHRLYIPTGAVCCLCIAWIGRNLRPAAVAVLIFLSLISSGIFLNRTLAEIARIHSIEEQLKWEVAGPKHVYVETLYSMIENLNFYPEKAYYRELAYESAKNIFAKYPESALARLMYSYHGIKRESLRHDNEKIGELFIPAVQIFGRRASELPAEVPLHFFQKFMGISEIRNARPRAFILLMSLGQVFKENLALFRQAPFFELPAVQSFFSTFGQTLKLFVDAPLTESERFRIGINSPIFTDFSDAASGLFPEQPFLREFIAANGRLFK